MSNTLAVTLLLDRSGSMEACRSDALGAVNGYLRQLRDDRAVDASVSLLLFDSQSIDVVRRNEPVAALQDLAADEFQPRGGTPLLDAVAHAVAVLEQSGEPDNRRILVVMTDGYENASREHTHQSVARLLERKQKEEGWLVVYLGAGHDAWDQASRIGVVQGFSADFSMDRPGAVASALGAQGSRFVCGIDVGSGFTDRERRAMLGGADEDEDEDEEKLAADGQRDVEGNASSRVLLVIDEHGAIRCKDYEFVQHDRKTGLLVLCDDGSRAERALVEHPTWAEYFDVDVPSIGSDDDLRKLAIKYLDDEAADVISEADLADIRKWWAEPVDDYRQEGWLEGVVQDVSEYSDGYWLYEWLTPEERSALDLTVGYLDGSPGCEGHRCAFTTASIEVLNAMLDAKGLPYVFAPT